MTLFWKCSPEFAHCIVPFYTAPAAPLHKKVFELEKTIDTPNYAHCRTTGNVAKKNCLHNVVVFCFLVVRSYCAFSLGNWISTLTVAIISNLKISIDSYTTGNSPPDANHRALDGQRSFERHWRMRIRSIFLNRYKITVQLRILSMNY
jgi:hypothetical protein